MNSSLFSYAIKEKKLYVWMVVPFLYHLGINLGPDGIKAIRPRNLQIAKQVSTTMRTAMRSCVQEKLADALEMLADARMQSLFAPAETEEELRIVFLSQEPDAQHFPQWLRADKQFQGELSVCLLAVQSQGIEIQRRGGSARSVTPWVGIPEGGLCMYPQGLWLCCPEIYVCMYICMYKWVYVCMYICVYVFM